MTDPTIRRVAWYRIRPEEEAAVVAAVEEFVTAIHRYEPETVYRTYRLDDGVSFLHWMEFASADAESWHRGAPYTLAFVERLYPLCEREPTFETLTPLP